MSEIPYNEGGVMNFMKRVGVLVLGALVLAGHDLREVAASTPPGTGLVIIISPVPGLLGAPGKVAVQPGATQVSVHLEVVFGKDVAGTPANPGTFSASVSGMGASVLTPLFTDVKNAQGTVTGKKADVTLPLKKKYTFKASVLSVLPAGATKAVKGSAKLKFVPVPSSLPAIQNFRISNPVATTSGGKPVVNTGQSTHFQADLISPDGEALVSYTLDPGDGSTPITRTAAAGTSLTALDELVVYSSFGDFTASLKVTNATAQSATQTLPLHANVPPTAKLKINPTRASFRYPVTFDALDSGDSDGDALTYTFNFGDGSAPVTGTSPTVTYTYPNPGVTKRTYSVSLTVTDVYNVSATTKSSLVVQSGLTGTPLLRITSPLQNEVASVTNNVLSVDVALGDASSGAAPDPTTFKATLNKVNVTSYFAPVKDAKRNNAVVGMHGAIPGSMVKMSGLNNKLYCKVHSVLFTTTGGTVRTISGSHSVGFTAQAVTAVPQPPVASFTATPAQANVNQTVTFNATASVSNPPGHALTFAWDFGDGNTQAASSSATATHSYSAAGPYTVTLTVADGALTATATSSVLVQTVVTGGTPALTVAVPEASGNSLDFGDLNGTENITVLPNTVSFQKEIYPAWVEKCVEITNTGTGTLTVTGLSIDNANFQLRNAADVQQKTLGAGESDFIGIRFNPRPYTPGGAAPAPAANGPQSGTLTVTTNAATNGTQTVSLMANVVSDVPTSGIRLMRSDIQRPGDDSGVVFDSWVHQPGDASVLDLGIVATNRSFLFGSVVNEGDASATITGVDVVVDDAGTPSPDFSAVMVYTNWASRATPESAIAMAPGSSLENQPYNSQTSQDPGNFILVTFHPTNTVISPQRLSARLLIHTDSGVVQIVGLTGIGVDEAYYTLTGGDFEFSRTTPGNTTTSLYQNSNVSPATIVVKNIGRKSGIVTASISGINGGTAPAFSLSSSSLTLGPSGQGTFTLTFAPSAVGEYAGVLKVVPESASGAPLSFEPVQTYLLHGYGKGGVGMMGSAAFWYTYDGSDFNSTEMISMDKGGNQTPFSQIDGLQDPFMVGSGGTTNSVDMNEYGNPDWSALIMLNGSEYTIDGSVFGPYVLSNNQLNPVATNRLNSNQHIYSGGIETHAGFVAFTPGVNDGHWDIQSDPTTNDTFPAGVSTNGADPIRLDVTPDGILFYTAVSSNLNTAPTPAIITTLKWWNPATKTGGVIASDVMAAIQGVTNDELLDMRVIKTATGYRAFFILDDSDAAGNQLVYDMDISSAFAPTAHKTLTGTLSPANNANAGQNSSQPPILDANGFCYTSGTVNNADGTSTMTVYRENLHSDAGAVPFGSFTVNFGDADQGMLLLDNQGNVFLMTNDGICAFSSSGSFLGYVMESQTYYANAFVGGSGGSDTQDLSDFNAVWLDK